MRPKLLIVILLAFSVPANAQLEIFTPITPNGLVSILCPMSHQISNVKFNGSTANADLVGDQASRFVTLAIPTTLDMTQGIILSSGKTTLAAGPNNVGNGTSPSSIFSPVADPDLAMLATNIVRNHAVLEFDFLANGNHLNLNFLFASEEYPEFSNTAFTDVMGIFLSGPGISGPFTNNGKNIALVPFTTTPVGLNTINNGLTNSGPCMNCNYYVNNGIGATPSVNSSIQYDGFTTPIMAEADLIAGEMYHIKLAVGNVGDNAYDSAVFFNANSFNTGETDPICEPSDLCLYTFTLTDNGGDGLNGEVMSVYQNSALVQFLYDISNSTNQTFEFAVPLCHDTPFELYWNDGGLHPEQTGVTIKNPFYQIIYNKPAGQGLQNTTLYTGLTDCTSEMSTTAFDRDQWFMAPNPAKNQFEIKLADPAQNLTMVKIFNISGKVVLTQNGGPVNSVAVGHLPSGIYLVEIETDDTRTSIKKLVIE